VAALRPALARRYAEALYDVVEEEEREAVLAALRRVAEWWRQEPQVRRLLGTPNLPSEQRLEALEHLLGAPLVHPLDFLLLMLLERRRHGLIPLLPAAFEEVLDEQAQVTRVVVASAVELTEGQRRAVKALAQRLAGRAVRLEERVEPGLLGGLQLRIGDRLADASLRGHLERLVERLRQAPVAESWAGP
jgi:F-type H+-transporting ATPase subunit delta